MICELFVNILRVVLVPALSYKELEPKVGEQNVGYEAATVTALLLASSVAYNIVNGRMR